LGSFRKWVSVAFSRSEQVPITLASCIKFFDGFADDGDMRFSDQTRVRVLAVAAVLAIVGVGVPFVTRKHSEWDDVYRNASQRLLDGASLYPPGSSYVYPPLPSLLVAPFALMPDRVSRLAWYAINMVCVALLLTCGWKLASSRAIVREPWLFWIGMTIGFPFVLHTLAHQQIDIVIAAMVGGGCYALTQSRMATAVWAFGLAAAIKCTPLLFAAYLLVKGRPFAALAVVVIAIVANLLPDVVSRPNDASCHLEKWYRNYIAPMVRGERAPGVWASEVIYNQSLIGAANRWTQTTWTNDPSGKSIVISAVPSRMPIDELKRLQYGLFAGIGAAILAAMLRGRRVPNALAWECSLGLSAMILLSPMSSIPHFATMIVPAWLLTDAALRGRRELWPFVAVMLVGALLSNKDLVGGRVYTLGLWYGSVMWTSVAAFGGCAFALATAPRANATVFTLPHVESRRKAA
jgi:Glycosyltransferase family 87